MIEARMKLRNMGLILFGDHYGNFIIDSEGVCRVIDYEAIVEASIIASVSSTFLYC